MKVEYNNLYTHFIFTTFLREPIILNTYRERIEKYITGIALFSATKVKVENKVFLFWALECLEKADSLKPVYNHNTFLHLEVAKKAVAGKM